MKLTGILFLFFLISCSEDRSKDESTASRLDSIPKADSVVKPAYFPVHEYIASEVRAVDSLPIGIRKIVTRAGQTDSTYIKLEEFHQLSGEFLGRELQGKNFMTRFKETSFFDRSTNTSTFLYTPNDANDSIQRVDVLAVTGDVYDKVKSIYIQKSIARQDTTFTKKMYWSAGKSFQINTRWTAANKTGTVLTKVIWDNMEE